MYTWIIWLKEFLVNEIPAAIDGKEGGTFSEQVWDWFNTWWKRIALLLFMLALTLHLVFEFSVIPVILLALPIGVIIWRKSMFRWDKWLEGALASGALASIVALPELLGDGITISEWKSLGMLFLGGVILYCKAHPPVIVTDEAIVTQQAKVDTAQTELEKLVDTQITQEENK